MCSSDLCVFSVSETKPAARTQLISAENPASSTTSNQDLEICPAQLSVEALQTQDTTLQIKPAKTEACPELGMANPSTKDYKAIISTTKEPSTTSVPFTDQPMEISLPQPSSTDVVRASFLETVPKELNVERRESIFHHNLAETVKPPASSSSEAMDTTPENKPNLSFASLYSEEKPLKTSVERLVEMVSSPSHSSLLARGLSSRELPQILPSLGDHSSVLPTTTLIPFTPKIGMGKPAITKRKFSPGRPRVKQVWIKDTCRCVAGSASCSILSTRDTINSVMAAIMDVSLTWLQCMYHTLTSGVFGVFLKNIVFKMYCFLVWELSLNRLLSGNWHLHKRAGWASTLSNDVGHLDGDYLFMVNNIFNSAFLVSCCPVFPCTCITRFLRENNFLE